MSSRFKNVGRTKIQTLEPLTSSQVCEVLTPEQLSKRCKKAAVRGDTDLVIATRSLASGM